MLGHCSLGSGSGWRYGAAALWPWGYVTVAVKPGSRWQCTPGTLIKELELGFHVNVSVSSHLVARSFSYSFTLLELLLSPECHLIHATLSQCPVNSIRNMDTVLLGLCQGPRYKGEQSFQNSEWSI